MIESAWDIFALVLSVGCGFLFFYVIKLLIQLKDILKTAENTLIEVQTEIIPVLGNVEGITGNVEHITGKADEIIGTVQTKTSDTLSIVDNVNEGVSIVKHSFLVFINKISRYFKAFGIGFKVGLKNFRKPELLAESNIPNKNKSTNEIIDHLEKKEASTK